MSGLENVLTKDAFPRKYSHLSDLFFLLANTLLASGPLSQAVKAAGQVWVAGQTPTDRSGNLIHGSIAEKTAQCCANIKAILKASGSDMSKVVRVGIFLTNMEVRWRG